MSAGPNGTEILTRADGSNPDFNGIKTASGIAILSFPEFLYLEAELLSSWVPPCMVFSETE